MNYTDALRICSNFTEGLGGDNPEYERGQLELLADLYPRPGIEVGIRVEEIAADIRWLADDEKRATGEHDYAARVAREAERVRQRNRQYE